MVFLMIRVLRKKKIGSRKETKGHRIISETVKRRGVGDDLCTESGSVFLFM